MFAWSATAIARTFTSASRLSDFCTHTGKRFARSLGPGINVIVDDVSLEEHEWRDWCAALEGLEPVWVAVRCDVEVAALRESARGDRALGLARGQADAVHRFPAYDLELDTTAVPVDEVARQLDDFLETRALG